MTINEIKSGSYLVLIYIIMPKWFLKIKNGSMTTFLILKCMSQGEKLKGANELFNLYCIINKLRSKQRKCFYYQKICHL